MAVMTVTGVVYRTGNLFRNRWEWLVAGEPGHYVWHGYTLTRKQAVAQIDRIINGGYKT